MDSLNHRVTSSTGRTPVTGLSEQIILALEEAILLGKLRSGDRIVETDIAAKMGTSNGPVRDALHELENLGLVISIPRRGTFVTQFTAQLAREVFSLRALLEASVIRLTVGNLRDCDVDIFSNALAEMGRYPDGPASSHRLLVESDLQFHEILFDISQHRLLRQAWQRLRVQAMVLLIVTGALWNSDASSPRERALEMVKVHQPLVEALQARDAPLAERRFVEHLAEGERRLIRKLAPADEDQDTLVDALVKTVRLSTEDHRLVNQAKGVTP